MKQTLTIHIAWALIATVAFVIGSRAFPTADKQEEETITSRTRRANSASAGARDRDSSAARTRGNRSYAGDTSSSKNSTVRKTTPLTEGEIVSLGKRFQSENNPIQRRLIFSELISGLTTENAELMRQQIAHLGQDSPEFREFHYAWGALAGEYAVQHGADTPKRDMAAALSGWASVDPDAALAWYQALPEDQQMHRGDFKWGAAYGLANNDPSIATEFVLARQQAGDGHAKRMIHIVADALLRSDGTEAAAQWSQSLPAGDVREEAINKVAHNYSQQNPQETVSWLQTLDDSSGKHRGMHQAYAAWASKDPEAAADSLNKLPESSSRDSAIGGYARRIVHSNPSAGVEWASSISNPSARNRALIDTGRVYMRRDPAAAKQWIESNNIPKNISRHILPKPKK